MATKRPRRVSQEQIEYLEWLIWHSKDANEFAKKTLIWLVRQSEGLTRAIKITDRDIVIKVAEGFHDMMSDNGTTHINRQIKSTTGSDMLVNYHCASIWNRKSPSWDEVTTLTPTQDEIETAVPT